MGGRIGFGLAKYAPARVYSLIIGGSHPYGRQSPPSRRLDNTGPEAFAAAFLERMGLNPATLPAEIREDLLANDFQALAAAQQDHLPSLEDVLRTMTMPCLLYIGEADRGFSQAKACIKEMPNATFVSLPGLNHPAGFMRSDVVLPHVTKFLRAAQDSIPKMA